MLEGSTGWAFARDDDGPNAEIAEGVVDAFLAAAAVGGHGARRATGGAANPFDGAW